MTTWWQAHPRSASAFPPTIGSIATTRRAEVTELFEQLLAAHNHIPAERMRAAHDLPMHHVGRLIACGRAEGAFRADPPTSWMVAVYHSVIHGAATEIAAGRLADDDAADLITSTLLAAYAPPAE
ncbi:hypothetical protein [Nocardia sp. NBC_00403]|uniref:hypothetical protein n=1 Tax=Nocardia sp. NBC_00403 TaxID=2975990 RepID=UPI002E22FBF9